MLTTRPIVNGPVDGASIAVYKNMAAFNVSLQLGLEDLQFERRGCDLGRLAFLAYCETQRWARGAAPEPTKVEDMQQRKGEERDYVSRLKPIIARAA